jgi:hypothetical protein
MDIINKLSDMLNFGPDGSIAIMLAIGIIAIALIVVILKFFKKIIGTGLTIVLIIAILFASGTLSISQLKNYAESAGSVIEEGYPESTEDIGSWILHMIEDTAPEDAGTWVPKK